MTWEPVPSNRPSGISPFWDVQEISVNGIVSEKGGFIIETQQGTIQAGAIVNAAGLFADKIAEMAGVDDFKITYDTKGSCLILDTLLGDIVHHIVTALNDPEAFLRYKLVTPTFHEKILIYNSFPEPAKGIEDRSVPKRLFDVTIEGAKTLVPDVDFEQYVIASYSAIAARNDRGDFIIEASGRNPNFIQAAIPPPGLMCSPAVSKRVVDLLKNNGLEMEKKRDFNPYRKGIRSLRRLSSTGIGELVKEDPRNGRVVCRCEKVTEGEIVEAVRRGATTLDGIKFRTRACMGRCQTNYCGPEITGILARELKQPFSSIIKKGRSSNVISGTGS